MNAKGEMNAKTMPRHSKGHMQYYFVILLIYLYLEMKTTENEIGGNLKSAGGLGAAPGPQSGSRGEAPVGNRGRSPRKNMGFQLFHDLISIEN